MDSEIPSLWYWVLLGSSVLIFSVLGYLFGKVRRKPLPDSSPYLELLDIENAKLKADLDTCKKRLAGTKPPGRNPSAPEPSPQKEGGRPLSEGAEFKALFGREPKMDDLKVVEGIGPKIEALFHQNDVRTWKQLSELSADHCRKLLDSGGKRYRLHDPASWPMQAKMAHQGHWHALFDWQEKHRAGRY